MERKNLRERLARGLNNPEEKAMIMSATNKDLLLRYCKGILQGRLVVGLSVSEREDLEKRCEDVLREYGELGTFHFLNPPKTDDERCRQRMRAELYYMRPSWDDRKEIKAWHESHDFH